MSHQPDPDARSFGSVAEAYERGRPPYPAEAATWLVGDGGLLVLELGAGTGKLTERLVALGHDVRATDPDPRMLAVLERKLPQVRTAVAAAEELPLADRSVDVVVAGQAFHWFDLDRALPEIARVLRPGGRLAVTWNQRDERIPWVRRLGALIGTPTRPPDPGAALVLTGHFGFVEEATYRFWQRVDGNVLQDLVLSRSVVATMDEAGRAAKLADVRAFYDEFGRGFDGMQLPYECRCFRTNVVDRPYLPPLESTGEHPRVPAEEAPDRDGLLIDFR